MKSFHLYLGRLGLLLGQFAVYRARHNTGNRQRRWYRLAMWLYANSSPLGMLVAMSVGIEAAMMLILDPRIARRMNAVRDAVLRDESGRSVDPGYVRPDNDYADRVDRPEIGF